jgi:hypothetical protein
LGAERLDAQLEPLAEVLLLLMLLIAVATITSLILSKLAARRRERRHNQLSASKRLEHTGIDLFGRDRPDGAEAAPRPRTHKARSSGGDNLKIDLSRKPDETRERRPENPVDLWLKSEDKPGEPGEPPA